MRPNACPGCLLFYKLTQYSESMKRIVLGIVGILLLGGLFGSSAHAQNVNNFTIKKFEADYYLSQDSEGRSQLKTVETIVAEFPGFNQNHGLERAIPKSYDGHSTSLNIESITDENGQALPYSEYASNDNLVLRIGDADTYVHGLQVYVITYSQRDVTRYFANTNDDEFYWDINGTQWSVPIEQLRARVHVGPSLSGQLTDQASCYKGADGSTTGCSVQRGPSDDNGAVVSAEVDNLAAHETMTMAVGFKPHTFTEYQPSWQERLAVLWVIAAIVSAIGAAIVIIWTSIKYAKILRRAKGRSTIIPEYLPPKTMSVLVSAQVIKNSTVDVTAQLIDFAVRHYLKIYQVREKTTWKQAEYELELVKQPDDLLPEEQGLLQDLFGTSLKPGDRFAMKELQEKYTLRKKLLDRRKDVRNQVRDSYGLFEQAAKEAGWFRRFGFILLIIGIVILSPAVLIAAIVLFVFAHTLWPLTKKGAELRDYLEGLKFYINVAEKERLQMLQSPEGAEKVGKIDEKSPGQLVKLYERVLPYAVLFGQEKEWTRQLGAYYETAQAQPDWYVGHGAFNAVVFSSAVSGFSSTSSSYSSSSNASTGGADGGGSAGGGGGGGGGGGW